MRGPAEQDIEIYQGASFKLPFALKDDDDVAVSMAGATIRGKVRNDLDDAASIIDFTGTVTDGPNGEGEITLTATQTAGIVLPASPAKKRPRTRYLYDVEVLFSDAQVQRILEGNCYVSPEATK
jgi:hypothetical protein